MLNWYYKLYEVCQNNDCIKLTSKSWKQETKVR